MVEKAILFIAPHYFLPKKMILLKRVNEINVKVEKLFKKCQSIFI